MCNLRVFKAPWGIKLNRTPVVGESLAVRCVIPDNSHGVPGIEWRRQTLDDSELDAPVNLRGCIASPILNKRRYTVDCRTNGSRTNVTLHMPGSVVTSSLNGSYLRCVEFNKKIGSRFLQLLTVGTPDFIVPSLNKQRNQCCPSEKN